ncbi:hypothetical protein L1049_019997 [Liquidambar formosana]|uniref:Uncharacterized protein n=1 Tax=Liquidambar formosana TaxID=63359 RepID=A0AAP0X9J6_LIQFO
MGGNSRQKKSSIPFSMFNFFKSKRPQKREDTWDDAVNVQRIWPSDEDNGHRVADPFVDKKATILITRFFERRVSESKEFTNKIVSSNLGMIVMGSFSSSAAIYRSFQALGRSLECVVSTEALEKRLSEFFW